MTEPVPTPPIVTSFEKDGEVLRIVLDRPKGNVLDLAMITAIRERLQAHDLHSPRLKLVVFEGRGPHFSFGASIGEHLPDKVARLIPAFHALLRELEATGIPTAAVVRGSCLGGALELAAFCGIVVCDETAILGVPEINLGVFPPAAVLVLPWRVGGARATRLILSGQTLDVESALSWGLVDIVSDDAAAAFDRWFAAHMAQKSALALRYAWRASRRALATSLDRDLVSLEALYLNDLMRHTDPVEGLTAFLERRPPRWTHA